MVACGARRGRLLQRRAPGPPSTAPGEVGSPSTTTDPIEHITTPDGRTRDYVLHVPSPEPSGPRPLVLMFHGGSGTAQGMEGIAHFDQISDEHGFIAVYPQGWERSWNDHVGNTPAEKAGVDDVAFVGALLDRLESTLPVDPRSVAVTGLSNGGLLSELLGCTLAPRLAVIAPVAASMPQAVAPTCAPSRPVSVLEIHGTDDPFIPYGGGQGKGFGGGAPVVSAEDSNAEWARLDRCGSAASTSRLPDAAHDGTEVVVSTHSGCDGGAAVELYTVQGGGHTWPGGRQYWPMKLIGVTTRQFDAGEVLWQFLQQHPST